MIIYIFRYIELTFHAYNKFHIAIINVQKLILNMHSMKVCVIRSAQFQVVHNFIIHTIPQNIYLILSVLDNKVNITICIVLINQSSTFPRFNIKRDSLANIVEVMYIFCKFVYHGSAVHIRVLLSFFCKSLFKINCVVACFVAPRFALANRIPLRFRTVMVYLLQ